MGPAFVDAHVHADGLGDADLETLARFGVSHVVVCAHDGALPRTGEVTAKHWLAHFENLLSVQAPRLRTHGIRGYFVFGVHPAHAPRHGFEELLHKLPQFLSDPAAVGIGTLGLKTSDAREKFVLERQLELARDLRRPVWVSAPPLEGDEGLRTLAATLKSFDFPADRVLVGQVTPGMLPLLRACGFTLALEPSEGRLSVSDIVAIVRRHGAERFVLTSHAGEPGADFLALPGISAQLASAGLSEAVVTRVARDNALRFLGRTDAAARARTG